MCLVEVAVGQFRLPVDRVELALADQQAQQILTKQFHIIVDIQLRGGQQNPLQKHFLVQFLKHMVMLIGKWMIFGF